eukprot:gene7548-11871_t
MIELEAKEWACCIATSIIFPPLVPFLFFKLDKSNEETSLFSDPIWMYASVILLILTLILYFPGVIGAFFYMYYIIMVEKNLDRLDGDASDQYGKLKDGNIEEI